MVSKKICTYNFQIYYFIIIIIHFLRHMYLNKSLRESRFDPRGTQYSQIDPTLIHKRVNEAKRLTAAVDAILVCNNLT